MGPERGARRTIAAVAAMAVISAGAAVGADETSEPRAPLPPPPPGAARVPPKMDPSIRSEIDTMSAGQLRRARRYCVDAAQAPHALDERQQRFCAELDAL